MRKLNVCVLFGGMSPEHDASLRSAEGVLNNMDREKYNIFPVGITKDGDWVLYGGTDYAALPGGKWLDHTGNRRATISPVRGQGLLTFEGDCVVRELIDVVFPVLHGKNGEDGAIQGLLQLAGIPYVGSHVSASAVSIDKSLTKLVAENAGVTQAAWQLVRSGELHNHMNTVLDRIESEFAYPVFVKPARMGAYMGVSKADDREQLREALLLAGSYDEKILIEEFIDGREVEVAVMGNDSPMASVCGEINTTARLINSDTSTATENFTPHIPARISEEKAEQVRELAVKVYAAIGCQGLSRVDFFVTYDDERIVFNEINTLPGFTSISMYPELFAASGIPYSELIDQLLRLALEA